MAELKTGKAAAVHLEGLSKPPDHVQVRERIRGDVSVLGTR